MVDHGRPAPTTGAQPHLRAASHTASAAAAGSPIGVCRANLVRTLSRTNKASAEKKSSEKVVVSYRTVHERIR